MSLQQNSLILDLSECKIRHNFAKRTFDILFSALVLLLLSPLFLLLALLVTTTSRGKAIYGHQRIGRGGKPFRCFKFRTMHLDADKRLKEILATNPILRDEWERTHKLRKDPRVTAIGNILRKLSLDELPQFWNVLKGDLSVVGPRPVVREELLKFYGRKAPLILSIRPGLTGPWQISGRSNISYEERVSMDENYVKTHSLAGDLFIVLKTIPAMLSSRGAY